MYRVVLGGYATMLETEQMSIDDIDLLCIAEQALHDARNKSERGR